MRTFNVLCVCICFVGPWSQAVERPLVLHPHERPTLIETCDPRPDILPRPFYDNHVEYRARYNRPTFIGGFLAYEMSRTSQEAMTWKENYCAGNYDQHHMPPVYKTYYYPKPWEVLTVGARPDFASAKQQVQRVPGASESQGDEEILKAAPSSDAKTSEAESEAKEPDEKKREVVPSPNDGTSSRTTSSRQRPVIAKPIPRKAS